MVESSKTPLLDHAESTRCIENRCSLLASCFNWRTLEIFSGPIGALAVYVIASQSISGEIGELVSSHKMAVMLGVLVWMAMWWILEAVPISITSLLPLVLFPFLQIMNAEDVSKEYTCDIVFLMLGTFILALAIEKYDLHKRMALKILLISGGVKMDPRLVLLGFCAGPAFVSMWMSNTSAAVMMIPMAQGVLKNLKPEDCLACSAFDNDSSAASGSSHSLTISKAEDAEQGEVATSESDDDKLAGYFSKGEEDAALAIHRFSQGVILGVTYGTAVGGLATLIGCGPNVVLPEMYHERFPLAPQISFLQWLGFGLPLSILYLLLQWVFLCWYYCPSSSVLIIGKSLNRVMIEREYESLGPMSFAEKFVFCEFSILVVLWVSRTFGSTPGWGKFFGNMPSDGTAAVAAAIMLFVVPNKKTEGEMLMDWKSCKNLSWSVLLLLGGGFALSKGIVESGLSTFIGDQMQFLENVPYYLLTPTVAVIVNIATEFSSNTATATLFLPILADVAVSINSHPLLLMLPAVFSSNFAFILPSGTPPNALAHSTGHLPINDMLLPGFVMHAVGIVLLSLLTPTLGALIFGVNLPSSQLPWIFSK